MVVVVVVDVLDVELAEDDVTAAAAVVVVVGDVIVADTDAGGKQSVEAEEHRTYH